LASIGVGFEWGYYFSNSQAEKAVLSNELLLTKTGRLAFWQGLTPCINGDESGTTVQCKTAGICQRAA
jgi:hypothetical protein